jgi:hypothetical protein
LNVDDVTTDFSIFGEKSILKKLAVIKSTTSEQVLACGVIT